MLTSVCIVVALLILALFLIFAFDNRFDASKCIRNVMTGVLLSSFFLFLPCYFCDSNGKAFAGFRAAVLTAFYSMKALAGGQEIGSLENVALLEFESDQYRNIYLVLNYAYLLVGPLLASGFLISYFGDVLEQIRYHISFRRNYHIFSHLNENSIQIAQSISGKNLIVFCESKNADKALISKARECGAVLLYQGCDMLKMPVNPIKNKKLQFYLIHIDEDYNLAKTKQLILRHRDIHNHQIALNAFAESGTGIQVVESMDKGNVAVRFIDMTALLCNQLLLRYPLYDLPEGQKDISVMIVGCDKTGMRMLKTIAWCGILDGYSLKIRVYDKNAKKIEEKFSLQCREDMDNCSISFVEVDAETAAFENVVLDAEKGSLDVTYIVMAMGDDEKNMAIADRIFRALRPHRAFNNKKMPNILVRVRSGTKSGVYLNRDNSYLEARKIHLFGSLKDIYSESALFYTYLERLAFAVDLCYNKLLPGQLQKELDKEKKAKETEKKFSFPENPADMSKAELKQYLSHYKVKAARSAFTQNEYNRRSSMATALHISGKLYSCGIITGNEENLTDNHAQAFADKLARDPSLVTALAKNEHIRWNNFMRSEGFCRATEKEFCTFYKIVHDTKDKLSKRHLTLAPWEELDNITKLFNEVDQPYQQTRPEKEREPERNFVKNDEDIIEKIPYIISLASKLEHTKLDEKLKL